MRFHMVSTNLPETSRSSLKSTAAAILGNVVVDALPERPCKTRQRSAAVSSWTSVPRHHIDPTFSAKGATKEPLRHPSHTGGGHGDVPCQYS